MKFLKKKHLNFIFLLLGLALFAFFLYKFGQDAFQIIKLEINYTYLGLFVGTVFLSFVPYTLRFKAILDAYDKKISFFRLLKHTLAAFAVSYVTPASRIGGEPVRVYMLKKECDVDYQTGTTAVVMDKYVEFLGSILYGAAGLFLLTYVPGIPIGFKIIFGILVSIGVFIFVGFYYRSVNGKGSFSSMFKLLHLHKIKKIKHWTKTIKDIEKRTHHFFINHKQNFFKSFFYYVVTGLFFILIIKFLLLSIGVNLDVTKIILIITMWGLLNFVPTPASLGFLEAGQSGLFHFIQGDASAGLAMTLLLRGAYLIVVIMGFLSLSQFSGKQIWKKKVMKLKK